MREYTFPVIDNEEHRAVKSYMWAVRTTLSAWYTSIMTKDHVGTLQLANQKLLQRYRPKCRIEGYNTLEDALAAGWSADGHT